MVTKLLLQLYNLVTNKNDTDLKAQELDEYSEPFITSFLENFTYLNSEGKRSGFLFFGNSELTSFLENKAKSIIDKLNELKNQSIPLDDKVNLFLTHLKEIIAEVKQARLDLGEIAIDRRTNTASAWGSTSYYTTEIHYQVPYKAGKFESYIRAGLLAMQQHLTPIQKAEVNTVLSNLDETLPKRKLAEWQETSLVTSDNIHTSRIRIS